MRHELLLLVGALLLAAAAAVQWIKGKKQDVQPASERQDATTGETDAKSVEPSQETEHREDESSSRRDRDRNPQPGTEVK